MAAINGWTFMLVGAGMAAVVYFFAGDLDAFYYVAAAFFAYGLVKILFRYAWGWLKSKGKSKAGHTHNPHHAKHTIHPSQHMVRPDRSHQAHTQHQAHNNAATRHVFFCRRCGNKLGIHDNFCSKCGMQQR